MDLSDGVACAEVLHQLIPSHFTESHLAKIDKRAADDSKLKVTNLNRLKDALVQFYEDELEVRLVRQCVVSTAAHSVGVDDCSRECMQFPCAV
jgi:hypothetical protein